MLNDPLQKGFEELDRVGFAIRRPEPSQFHVGLLYKDAKKVYLRHQCDHLVLKEDEPSCAYLWTDIAALSPLNKRLIANKMSRAGGDKVPYGVGYRLNGNYLDKKTLKYLVTEPGAGLTCATYIIEVLETLGFFPFDRKNWLSTEHDTAWQEQQIEQKMRRHPGAKEHFRSREGKHRATSISA
jgi:hypothetical protein